MSLRSFLMAGALTCALASPVLAAEDGGDLFAQNCSACHQPKGEGVAGAFPPLAGNKFVVGDPKGPAYVVTHGRGGMPNFSGDLDDKQIATILSFVRSSWGNTAAPLDAAVVASVRGAQTPPNPDSASLPFH